MRKVLLVYAGDFETYPMGGVLEYTKNFARYAPGALACIGITIDPSVPVGQWTTVRIGNVERPFLPILFVDDEKQRRSRIPLNYKFIRALRRHRPTFLRPDDVVYIQRAEHWHAFKDTPNPLYFNTHGQSAFFEKWTRHPLFRWRVFRAWFYRMEALVFQHAQGIITISPADYDYYVGRFPHLKEKIHFVPLGIEIDEYQPQPRNEDGILRVLFVGRLDASKGLDLLVAGFAKFHARHPNSKLILVGGSQDFSPVEADVKRWIAEHQLGEAVEMTGLIPRQDILPYYHQADVFVLTSHWEGLPTALLEALACGVPAVVTNVGGMPSVVQDDFNGYVLNAREPNLLAELIERTLHNRKRLAQNARLTAERYSIQTHTQRVWQMMKMETYSQAVAQELVC